MTEKTGSEIVGTVNYMKKKGTFWVVAFGLIAGLILLIMGGGGLFENDSKEESDESIEDEISAFEYKAYIEEEIRRICKSVSGVDEVYVCVRLKGGAGRVYATDKQYGSGGEREEYVIIGSGSGAKPLYLYQSLPEILGIGVIIKGNNVSGKKSSIEAMLSAAYGVPQNKVWVEIN